jgi:hypothetical protein
VLFLLSPTRAEAPVRSRRKPTIKHQQRICPKLLYQRLTFWTNAAPFLPPLYQLSYTPPRMESTQKVGSRDARLKSRGCLSCIRMKVKAGESTPKAQRHPLTFYSAMKPNHTARDAREATKHARAIETRTPSSSGPRVVFCQPRLPKPSCLRAPALYPPQYLLTGFNVPSPTSFATTCWRRRTTSRGTTPFSRGFMRQILKQDTFGTRSKQLH